MEKGFGYVNQRFEIMQSDMEKGFGYVNQRFEIIYKRFEMIEEHFDMIDNRFENLEDKLDNRFNSLEKRLDATNFTIRILGVPIVGATIGGLGIIFLQIYERLFLN